MGFTNTEKCCGGIGLVQNAFPADFQNPLGAQSYLDFGLTEIRVQFRLSYERILAVFQRWQPAQGVLAHPLGPVSGGEPQPPKPRLRGCICVESGWTLMLAT